MPTKRPLEGIVVIFVLHLLSDVQGFIEAVLRAGLPPERMFLLNIPYSTKPEAVANLWTRGVRNLYISKDYPIAEAVKNAVADAEQVAERENCKIVILEDGGYVGPYIHLQRPDLLPKLLGIVEQTANGIWQYDEQSVEPRVPVVNVAESALKKNLESPLIGLSIVRNVENLIGQLGYGLASQRVLLLGFGATGKEAAKHLLLASKSLVIFDSDSSKREDAEKAGYKTVGTIEEACGEIDVLIGCTGRESINADALLALRGATYFANGSSKRRELAWEEFRDLQGKEEELAHGAKRIELLTNASVILLADGYPVNFVSESVPDEEIAFIYGLLFRALLFLLENELSAGFHDVPLDIQNEIERNHNQMLGR